MAVVPYYKINDVDMLPYLGDNGIVWEENDIDHENSGRTMDGIMHRKIVATKDKHTISFRALSVTEAQMVLNAITSSGDFMIVETNVHPKRSGNVSLKMYNSTRKAGVFSLDENGNSVWAFDSISLIER